MWSSNIGMSKTIQEQLKEVGFKLYYYSLNKMAYVSTCSSYLLPCKIKAYEWLIEMGAVRPWSQEKGNSVQIAWVWRVLKRVWKRSEGRAKGRLGLSSSTFLIRSSDILYPALSSQLLRLFSLHFGSAHLTPRILLFSNSSCIAHNWQLQRGYSIHG